MPRPSTRAARLMALGLLCAAVLPATAALASEPRVAVAVASTIPSGDTVVSQVITTPFDVVLAQPDPTALTSFIASLSNVSSPNYRHFLTPAQFARRFGATSSSIAAVRSYLEEYGLHVGALSTSHLVLHVSGTTSDIARAFNAPLVTVRRSDGVLAAQFTRSATLPSSVGLDVASVAGLSSVTSPRPMLSVRSVTPRGTGPTGCASAGSSSGTSPNALSGFTAVQQGAMYGLSNQWTNSITGVGQTIGVYELGNYSPSDLSTFYSCYGVSPVVTNVPVDGGSTGGYIDEATLDVEEAGVLAPGAAIRVYTGPNANSGPIDVYQQMADDNTATVISVSWGTCEADPSGDQGAEQVIFEQMAAQGQTVVASAGDNGSSDCSGVVDNSPAVDDPASQPYVTGVGGLTVNNYSPLDQQVWNDGAGSGGGAGGGGVSQTWSRPTWQSAPGITGSDTMRMVPDLSVMADPGTGFIQYYSGATGKRPVAWSTVGGTSIGSPLVSSLVAVAAQYCSVPRLGFINPALYAMASTGFNDVTQGNNDLFGVKVYNAGVGYDMASGLGSPNPATFIPGLCPATLDLTKSSLKPAVTTSVVNNNTAVALTLHDTRNNPITNAIVHLDATASGGTILIDQDPASFTSSGKSAYDVTTDANGSAAITVSSTSPGPVTLVATYLSHQLTTTLTFTSSATPAKPGRASIARLVALVGGFKLTVAPPSSNGGSPITVYQYSLDSGVTWMTFSAKTMSTSNTRLVKGRKYRVIVRARNANGAGPPSAAASVTART